MAIIELVMTMLMKYLNEERGGTIDASECFYIERGEEI